MQNTCVYRRRNSKETYNILINRFTSIFLEPFFFILFSVYKKNTHRMKLLLRYQRHIVYVLRQFYYVEEEKKIERKKNIRNKKTAEQNKYKFTCYVYNRKSY